MNKPWNAAGSAAPQCGDHSDLDGKSGECRSGERHSQRHSQHRGWYSWGYIPHFDSPHVIQHITYRLADSLPLVPKSQLGNKRTFPSWGLGTRGKMQAEIEASVQDEDKRETELRRRIETYLDAGHGSCILQVPEIAECVIDTWHHFDGNRYRLLEWVVMPNHCHVLIEPFAGAPLGKIVLSWKNYTARFINEYKRKNRDQEECRSGERHSQRHSQVWQRDYWDRFIRNERHFEAAKNYIIMNPVKAGLVLQPEDWLWGIDRLRTRKLREKIADLLSP